MLNKLSITLHNIALVKEIESLENPGGLDRRVALIPCDVGKLRSVGVHVFVESGAGEGVGFSDKEYLENGAIIQSADQIYKEKDIIVKFKGPALESIPQMKKNCTLLCMAHFNSFPQRAQLLKDHHINVIAMEEILESPKIQTDEQILAREAMAEALKSFIDNKTIDSLKIVVIGYNDRLAGSIRRAGNRNPYSLEILYTDVTFAELKKTGKETLYFFDSQDFSDANGILEKLKALGSHLFDLHIFELKKGKEAIAEYRESHPPFKFGLRRIQCLHETGQAGARYGIKLLKENKPEITIADAKVVVLGYGNVARGAMHELYEQGIKNIHVLGRTQTTKERIGHWLQDVDLIVNGAELPPHLRGVTFLITNDHIKTIIPAGSVVIDLVSGSETNRSAVEPVLGATFLTEPFFIQDEVTISSLWGWPMMGMNRESTEKYSSQVVDVLIGREKLLEGLDTLTSGVQRALVCGLF
ncbi:MAG: alanine dehydrogenase [Thermodesulfobacteriota bacterium]|nr:alanine dehydrogenase [Thermodesulfobacteriota bacterium]